MPRVLFIDVAPFAGGAQTSFRTLIECAEGCDKALAVGDGLWIWLGAEPAPLQAKQQRGAEPAPLQAEQQRGAEPAPLQAEQQRGAEPAPLQAGQQRGAEPAPLQAEQQRGAEPAPLQAEQQRGMEKRGMEKRGLCPALRLSTSHWRATLGGFLRYRWECWKNRGPLLELIHSFKPDIIHCNTVRSALMLCALPRLEAIIIVHDRDLRMPSKARHYVVKHLSPFIFAVSSTVCDKWREIVPDDRRFVLFNGFDLEAIASTKPTLPDGRNTVIIAADFEPWKCHQLFLDAIALAQKEHPQLSAILKGRLRPSSAKYLEELRNHVKECDIKNLRFIVDDTPALPWIASAQVLVTCSENEPFGRTAIEALALGKRVVATETALAPELFGLDGVTRSKSSALELSKAILQAINAPHPAPDLSRFSEEALTKELKRLYARVMAKKKG